MTQLEFERMYCERSGITLGDYRTSFITLPCACDAEECKGWAAVNNDAKSIVTHKELYAPREAKNA